MSPNMVGYQLATQKHRSDDNAIFFNSKKLSIKGDRLAVYTGSMTSGSTTLTTNTASVNFAATDIGKTAIVAGAGAAGATLRTTIASYIDTKNVRLTAAASTTVSNKYTVWGTDDTAAFRAALLAMSTSSGNAQRGGVLLIAKNSRIMLTSTVDILRLTGAITGTGFCDWNAGYNALSMGSMLFWDGPSGSPMLNVQGCKFFRFENLGIIGNPTADSRPSALLRFNVPDSSTTNGQITIDNCVVGRYGGYGGFTGGNAERVADIGVLMDGENANNDRFRVLGSRIEGCTTGTSLPNSQSTLGGFDGTTFFENDTHLSTAASVSLRSVYLGKSAVRDFDLTSSARVTLRDVGSEFSAQFARMRGQSKLVVDGGYFNLTSSLNGDKIVIDAVDNTRQTIRLRDFLLGSSTGWTVTDAPVLIEAHASTDSALSNKIIELDNVQYPNATNIGVTPSWFDVTPVGNLESVTVYGNVQPAGGGNQNHGIQQFFYNILRSPSGTLNFNRDDRLAATDCPTAAFAETFERRQTLSASAGTSGRLVLSAIYLKAGQTVTSISFGSGSTALATPSNGWGALYSPSLGLLGQSTDDTGITWAANSKKTFTLATPAYIPTTDWYYVGYCIVASTMPTVLCASNNVFTTESPAMGGWSTTGLTGTAPATAAALSAAPYPYAYVA